MQQLENYISDLLYRYDCVTIPEFGSLLTRYHSAAIHDTTNAFYPPRKIISFNAQIKENDGLLANYIAKVESISYALVVEKLKKEIRIIHASLQNGITITFKNIGDFKLNEEGNIVFSPSYHINYLTDSFGFNQFTSPLITREVAYEAPEKTEEKIVPAVAVVTKKTKSNTYYRYAAIGLLALTLGGVSASYYYRNAIFKENEIAQQEAEKELDSKLQEATFVIQNPLPSIAINLAKQKGKFHIVAGVFREAQNSKKKLQELHQKGYNAYELAVNKYGLHEIVYASYSSRNEAVEALRKIKAQDNKDAWLLIKDVD